MKRSARTSGGDGAKPSDRMTLAEFVKVAKGVVTVGRLLPAVSRGYFATMCCTTLTLALVPLAVTILSAQLLSTAVEVFREGSAAAGSSDLVALAVALVVVFVVRAAVISLGALCGRTMSRRLDGSLRERVMRAAMAPTGIRHLEDPELKRLFESARNLSPLGFTPGVAALNLPIVVSMRLTPIFFGIALLWYSIPFALLLLVTSFVGQAEMYRLFMTQLRQSYFVKPRTEPQYFRDLCITPPAAKDIRVFGLGGFLGDRYRSLMSQDLQQTWRRRKLYSHSMLIMFVVCGGSLAAALVYFSYKAGRGDLGFGDYVFTIGCVFSLNPSLVIEDISVSYGAAVVPAILKAEAAATRPVALTVGEPASDLPRRSICFENVSFRYNATSPPVLDRLDLELHAGQRTAIVGVNGAGKTTIVKLLCGLYEPSEGLIRVDGKQLSDYDVASWRRQLAVLFQDFVRYELSASDNVRYGALAHDEGAVGAAAARIGADAVIARLPEQWQTTLSPRYTGGADLSGGEWQRVAFARALFAVDAGARVLVLDEPTANLDVRAEAELYEQFLDLTAARSGASPLTTVLISHRLSTVRRADRIVVIDGGRVAEVGSHDELLAFGGVYADMFNAQAVRFAEGDS